MSVASLCSHGDNLAPASANDDARNRTADSQLAGRCEQPLGQARPGARPPDDPLQILRKTSGSKFESKTRVLIRYQKWCVAFFGWWWGLGGHSLFMFSETRRVLEPPPSTRRFPFQKCENQNNYRSTFQTIWFHSNLQRLKRSNKKKLYICMYIYIYIYIYIYNDTKQNLRGHEQDICKCLNLATILRELLSCLGLTLGSAVSE